MTIEQIINALTRVSGVRMAALCTHDGIRICSEAPEGSGDENRLAAMSAEIGRAALVLARSWDGGAYLTAAFEATTGKLVVSNVGKAFVAIVADQSANLGLLRLRAEKAASELRGVISTAQGPESAVSSAETGPVDMPPVGPSGSLSV